MFVVPQPHRKLGNFNATLLFQLPFTHATQFIKNCPFITLYYANPSDLQSIYRTYHHYSQTPTIGNTTCSPDKTQHLPETPQSFKPSRHANPLILSAHLHTINPSTSLDGSFASTKISYGKVLVLSLSPSITRPKTAHNFTASFPH